MKRGPAAALVLLGAAVAAAACSSSSPPSGAPSDAGADGTVDGATESDACTPSPDASLSTFQPPDGGYVDGGFNGTACWACITGGCTAQVMACSQDCSCNTTVLKGAECLTGDAGSLVTCLLPLVGGSGIVGFLTGSGSGIDSALMNFGSCLMAAGCLDTCGAGGLTLPGDDAGVAEAGLDAGPTATTEAAVDGSDGSASDGSPGATLDAGADAADGL